MKVHFFGSLGGNTMTIGDKTNYEKIAQTIEQLGYEIITRHYITKKIDEVLKEPDNKHEEYLKKMTAWIKKADIVVVEVTKPEIGTGYELALALNLGKPIIALYTNGQNTPVLACQPTEKLQHLEYDQGNLKETLRLALIDAQHQMDVRFNFFIPPTIGAYLDWIAKHQKLPRAVFLRKLIEEHKAKNKEYKA